MGMTEPSHWLLYKDKNDHYVAVEPTVAARIQPPGEPCFGGIPVPEVLVWAYFKEAGGRIIDSADAV